MANDPRFTKVEVSYQAEPNRGARCETCVNFREQDTCTLVKGSISPDGWCQMYEGKAVDEPVRRRGRPRKT